MMAEESRAQVVPGASDPLQIQTMMCVAAEIEDFDPQPRDRCNTWPLQRPTGDLSHNTSPLIHEEIPEERSLQGSRESVGFGGVDTPDSQLCLSHSPLTVPSGAREDVSGKAATGHKKNTARRNAWGNMSYADLITQAIFDSPEKRLTLSQVYDWMVQNVPYFRDKGDSNSSAGWKNSIRHNLSLHSRFMRIQNEGAGKSSWWVINPDAKPGKASRRRAQTLETKTMEKKRGRAKKKVDQLRAASMTGEGSGGLSPAADSPDPFYDSVPSFPTGEFRTRSDSNLSNYSVGSNTCASRLSPQFEEYEGTEWTLAPKAQQELIPDILDMANNMRLADQAGVRPQQSPHFMPSARTQDQKPPSYNQATSQLQQPRFQSMGGPMLMHGSPLKLESTLVPCNGQTGMSFGSVSPNSCRQVPVPSSGTTPIKQEPPAYQELYPTSLSQLQANPMLRDALQKASEPQHYGHFQSMAPLGVSYGGVGPMMGINGGLPADISDIQYDSMQSHDLQCDIDRVLEYERKLGGGQVHLDFNMDYGN